MSEEIAIVAMRLIDMRRMHPHQDNSRRCSQCGQTVGLYPTGQNALKRHPGAKILCHVCAIMDRDKHDKVRAAPAGPIAEILQEGRDSYDVGKA